MMVLLAQHLARHRLREPQLLEAIAHFLVAQEAQLNSKVGLPPVLPRHPVRFYSKQPSQALSPRVPSLLIFSLASPPSMCSPPSTQHCLNFIDPTSLGLQGQAP